jgi:hypothetical protein
MIINPYLFESIIYIVSVEDPTPISVAFDTPFASISKPATVNATLSDSSVVALSVTWSEGVYDQDAAGDYDIFGTLTLPPDVTNPFLIEGHVVITVQEEVFVTTFTAPTGFQTYEILAGVTELTLIELIGGGASGGSIGTINRAPGSGGGSYKFKNNQAVTAGTLIPVYIAPQRNAIAPAGSNVDGEPGFVSYFGPSAPAGSTILSGSGAPGGGTGADGNYYSDIATGNFYGPKAAGAWPASSGGPWCRAAGGTNGTGISPGTGGQGGLSADGIGDGGFDGGDGIAAPASRSGAGGAAASPAGAGANATTSGGTNSVGGVGVAPGGSGGNGSTGTPGAATDFGGGGAGARSTIVTNVLGGTGRPGWGRITFSGASVPPIEPGDVHFVAIWGQSNACSPGNGSPGAPYEGPLNTQIYINSTVGYEPLEWGVNNNVGGSTTGLGPELSIATEISALAPNETYTHKKAQSGTSMYSNWNVGNNSTGRTAVSQLLAALTYLEAQGKIIRTITIVFLQGEADMNAANPNGPVAANVQAEYKDKFADLIKYTIDELEADGFDLDAAIGFRWIDVLLGDNYSGSADDTFKDDINAAKVDLMTNFDTDFPSYASKFAGGHTIDTNGLGRFDGIHYTTASEIQIGLDCAALMTWIP